MESIVRRRTYPRGAGLVRWAGVRGRRDDGATNVTVLPAADVQSNALTAVGKRATAPKRTKRAKNEVTRNVSTACAPDPDADDHDVIRRQADQRRAREQPGAEVAVLTAEGRGLRDPGAQAGMCDALAKGAKVIPEQLAGHMPCREHQEQRDDEPTRLHRTRADGQHLGGTSRDGAEEESDRQCGHERHHRRSELVERDAVHEQVERVAQHGRALQRLRHQHGGEAIPGTAPEDHAS